MIYEFKSNGRVVIKEKVYIDYSAAVVGDCDIEQFIGAAVRAKLLEDWYNIEEPCFIIIVIVEVPPS